MTNRVFARESVVRDDIMDYMIEHPDGTIVPKIEEETGHDRQAIHPQVRVLIDKGFLEWRDVIEEKDSRSSSFRIPQDKMAQGKWAEFYLLSGDTEKRIRYLGSVAARQFVDESALHAACMRILYSYALKYRKRYRWLKDMADEMVTTATKDGHSQEILQAAKEYRKDMGRYNGEDRLRLSDDTQRYFMEFSQTEEAKGHIGQSLRQRFGFTDRVIEELRYMLKWSPIFLQELMSTKTIPGPMKARKRYNSKKLQRFVETFGRVKGSDRKEMKKYIYDIFQTCFGTSMLMHEDMRQAAKEDGPGLYGKLYDED